MDLTPTQKKTVQYLESQFPTGSVFVLWAPVGFGKSTMLADLQERLGGRMVNLNDVFERMEKRHPLTIEDTVLELMTNALGTSDLVLIDDLDVLDDVVGNRAYDYPRKGFLNAALKVACTYAIEEHKKIVFACNGVAPEPVALRATYAGFKQFEAEDYKTIATTLHGARMATGIDYEKLHHFAPHLSGHHIRSAFGTLKRKGTIDTDSLMDILLESGLASNVNLSEVEAVDLSDLKGIDSVLQALDAHVVVPFEHAELAEQFDLQPKKGVLLYGPPGTGKTTIGRALAHRLKGKFFLIDGDFVSGSSEFFPKVRKVFEAARQNAPSVVFIDDSDVIFENEESVGFYRYLLTLLDGVENEAEGMVCVMMTAMDAGKLPAALIRSGRIELWLEMPLPDAAARRQIIDFWAAKLPEVMKAIDADALVKHTDGFTGADLRRLFQDARNLYAYDVANGKQPGTPTSYLLKSVDMVTDNKKRRSEAESRAKSSTPLYYLPFEHGADDKTPGH